MIAQTYSSEIRTICLLARAACLLPVKGMAALARRRAVFGVEQCRPKREAPAPYEDELIELVRRLRSEFAYDPALDPDADAA